MCRSYLPMGWYQLPHGLYQLVCWILYMYLFNKQTITELYHLNNHFSLWIQTKDICIASQHYLHYIYLMIFIWISIIKLWSLKNNSKQWFYLWYIFSPCLLSNGIWQSILFMQQFNFIPFFRFTFVLDLKARFKADYSVL